MLAFGERPANLTKNIKNKIYPQGSGPVKQSFKEDDTILDLVDPNNLMRGKDEILLLWLPEIVKTKDKKIL